MDLNWLIPAVTYPLLFLAAVTTAAALILWVLIKSAVKRALWEHHLRLRTEETREQTYWAE